MYLVSGKTCKGSYFNKQLINVNDLAQFIEESQSNDCLINKLYIKKRNIFPIHLPYTIYDIECHKCEFENIPHNLPIDLKILQIPVAHIDNLKIDFAPNLEILNITHNYISNDKFSLNTPKLKQLHSNYNKFTRLPENLPEGILEIYACFNKIEKIDEKLPSSLKKIISNHNNISEITPDLPFSLKILDCNNNKITKLPIFNQNLINLTELHLRSNNLTNIDNLLPPNLMLLNLESNKITHLPDNLPDTIVFLDLSFNKLLRLPDKLPNNLELLCLYNNNLELLPENLPDTIEDLNVADNSLTILPNKLPSRLYKLDCSGNNIETLPDNLPSKLKQLFCNRCNLINLPDNLPEELYELCVNHNQIEELPENLPAVLKIIMVYNNRLTNLPLSIQRLELLRYTDFGANELEITNPLLRQWFYMLNRDSLNVSNIYQDEQSIHNSSVNEGIDNSIKFIIKRNINPNKEEIITKLIENPKITDTVKNLILQYIEDTTTRSVLNITFADIFLMSFDLIIDKGIEDILNDAISSSECKCFMGKINRYVNVFNGIIPECTYELIDASVFGALFTHLNDKYNGNIEKIKEALIKKGYDEKLIMEWLDHL